MAETIPAVPSNPARPSDKETLLALRGLRQRVEELESAVREPIAIVGIACRFPGEADSAAGYWSLLLQGHNAVGEIPSERMALDSVFDPQPQVPGKTYSRSAGLLRTPGDFDADFFGISPREALSLDPQQRLLLEVSWEALEDAAIDPKSLKGKDAGVFVGVTSSEYAQLLMKDVPREELSAYALQGSALNAAAGRLSYFYGLNGPSMAIDTACSSSLVVVDRACRSLREDETSLAIAAGVNLLATPEALILGSQWGMFSPTGQVRAFDALADGFVRGEGCGVVVLKRLSAARMDGDRIHGLILGSAVNQDGASSGLTVPNGLAQQSLLRQALRRSGIEPWQVGYVEAHGTGTALGDPIEAEALGAVFGGSGRAARLPIGSVKTNIGHLESAAGVAGLLKLVLGLQHRVIPGQLHWTAPSPHVRWKELGLEVAASARAWEPIGGRRIGGVSSFGFSGTNAHVVVEGWEEPDAGLHPEVLAVERPDAGLEAGPEVLVLTARSEAALRELVARYASFLKESDAAWSSICWTAATGRAVFAERLAIVACGKAEAAAKLLAWLRGESPAGVYRGHAGRRAGAEAARGETGTEASADRAAAGFVQGEAVDWHKRSAGGNEGHTPRRIALPTYPFQRQRYWIETGGTDRATPAAGIATGQGMLGDRIRAAGVRGQFETLLREDGWVGQHRVQGRAVLPATGHVELMLEAAGEVFGATVFGASHSGRAALVLEDLLLQAPLTVSGQRRVQTVVELQTGGRSRVRIYAEQTATKPGEEVWETVSEAWLRPDGDATGHSIPDGALEGSLDVQAILKRLKPAAAGDGFYDALAARGLDFGPLFRGVRQAWVGEVGEAGRGEALGEIAAAATGTDHANEKWTLPPWWLDACLQVAGLAIEAQQNDGDTALYLPMSMERLELHSLPKSTQSCWSLVALVHRDQDNITANLTLTDHKQSPILQCKNLRFRKVHRESRGIGIYGVHWIEAPPASSPVPFTGHWVVLAEDDSGMEVCNELRRMGAALPLLIAPSFLKQTSAPIYRLSEADGEGHREVLREIQGKYGQIEGIIDLRTTNSGDFFQEATTPERHCLAEMQGCFSLLQALLAEQIRPPRGVWLVTRQAGATGDDSLSAEGHAVLALRRTAAVEFPELSLQHLELDLTAGAGDLLRAIGKAAGPESLLRGNRLLTPRLKELTYAPRSEPNEELLTAQSGLIDDLQTVPAKREHVEDDEVEIAVHAHGINFRDVMTALAMLPGATPRLGGECAGIVVQAGPLSGVRPGQRVFAFAPASFKRFVTVRGTYVATVPDGLSLAQAAALPVVYLTAIYGLDRLAALQPGQSILIHSAAGGLGLAAIHIAKARGATIYATAGSEEKRAYLHSLGTLNVFPSRTTDFADEVMRVTQGRGVDVVLNSLTGVLAEKTLSVLSNGGCFLEVGKRDTLSVDVVRRERPDVRYFLYDLGEEAAKDPSLVPSLLSQTVAAIEAGGIEPLPVTEFSDPRQAFRYLAQARHIGKVVVTRRDTTSIAVPPLIRADATYLITGGLGSLGLLFAEWLVGRGARHLTLIGRSAPGAPAQKALERMRSRGAEITLASADVADQAAMEAILQSIPPFAPLRAVLHIAGILDDHSLLDQDSASMAAVLRPKLQGAWNLHLLTRGCDLDFFVLFSSAAALLGSPGQSNYAIANATLDALAAYRQAMGLPALSVQWGPWLSDGMTRKLKADPASIGLGRIAPAEGYAALETLLASQDTVAAVLPVASWDQLLASRSSVLPSLFDGLAHGGGGAPKVTASGQIQAEAEGDPFRLALMTAQGSQRRAMMMEHLRQLAVQVLSLPAATKIDEDEALHDIGLDSLMAVELRNALVSSLRRDLPATTALDYPTLRTLTDFLLLDGSKASLSNREPGRSSELAAMSETDLKKISESEAEALLLAELRKQ